MIFEAPLNSLSFGNVSYNILRELYRKGSNIGIFPIGNIQLDSFNIDQDFLQWINSSIKNRWSFLQKDAPSFKLWHLNGSENRKSKIQNLFTFYECSAPTNIEIAICNSQDHTIFSSSYAKELFEKSGCENCHNIPLGFDEDFKITGKKYLEGVVHFGLFGKFENRKRTKKIIQTWLKKYGNDNKYQLTCCITNPFLPKDRMNAEISEALGGKRYTNINFLPFLKTNAEVNEVLNAIDIDLTGLSGGEGWNLPSFNATCLGKWSIVSSNTSHKDWANTSNSILVEPDSMFSCVDNVFFSEKSDFNQGQFFDWSEESCIKAMEAAEKMVGKTNENGLLLGKEFTYKNTTEKILSLF